MQMLAIDSERQLALSANSALRVGEPPHREPVAVNFLTQLALSGDEGLLRFSAALNSVG
jgi:hypothetical protein